MIIVNLVVLLFVLLTSSLAYAGNRAGEEVACGVAAGNTVPEGSITKIYNNSDDTLYVYADGQEVTNIFPDGYMEIQNYPYFADWFHGQTAGNFALLTKSKVKDAQGAMNLIPVTRGNINLVTGMASCQPEKDSNISCIVKVQCLLGSNSQYKTETDITFSK